MSLIYGLFLKSLTDFVNFVTGIIFMKRYELLEDFRALKIFQRNLSLLFRIEAFSINRDHEDHFL